ncbi:hypothetical protein I7I51_07174 [Histoplasma capsulatum]|uniref:Uncharacterized protein n=1 Tax=Ajellomyces capsulatus TaxID=5037 RepID=A0A8A1MQH7_AJECA|nr:hypothetical protein I7I51_07174 [Histoplasma capsulatum]
MDNLKLYQRFYITSGFLRPEHSLAPTIPFIRVFGFVTWTNSAVSLQGFYSRSLMAERIMPKSQKTQLRESPYSSLPSKCFYRGCRSRPSIEDEGVTTQQQHNSNAKASRFFFFFFFFFFFSWPALELVSYPRQQLPLGRAIRQRCALKNAKEDPLKKTLVA